MPCEEALACQACRSGGYAMHVLRSDAAAVLRPVQDEVFLNGTIVLPHKELKETVLDQGTIIM